MEKVKIAIVETKYEDMGMDSDTEFADLYFNPRYLAGYWISKSSTDKPDTLVFYIGGTRFGTDYSDSIRTQFNKILSL